MVHGLKPRMLFSIPDPGICEEFWRKRDLGQITRYPKHTQELHGEQAESSGSVGVGVML